jgi:hypothetical protein
MAVITMQQIVELGDAEHHGIKGMRWGVRRKRGPDGTVGSSPDAAKAAETAKLVRRHGTKAASNEDLRALVNRINLERDYARATAERTKIEKGQDKVARVLSVGKTVNELIKFSNSDAGRLLAQSLGASSGGKHAKGVDMFTKQAKKKKKK